MKFKDAIQSATQRAMEEDDKVVLMGVGITDIRANVYGTLTGLYEQFGPDRVIEGPLSENALTGIALGLALHGFRPILIHHRMDFTLLSMDQIVNHIAKWRAMFGDQMRVPLVIRAVVGRGWGNGVQHTQSLQATFAHIPGLRVVVPATPQDAYSLLLRAIYSDDPVVFIEHRWLHDAEVDLIDPVPGQFATSVMHPGEDVTVAAIGPLVSEAMKVARNLRYNASVEVLNVHSIAPLDINPILESVRKTGRLVVADSDWGPCSVASEIIAQMAEEGVLQTPPRRVCWPFGYVPSAHHLQEAYYPGAADIQAALFEVCPMAEAPTLRNTTVEFEGPF